MDEPIPQLALVMPMAGRGSRFQQNGRTTPKPLIDLFGRPFFSWAVESVNSVTPLREIVFVVLQEHVDLFGIDAVVHQYYPRATVLVIPDVTSGAAETAEIGVAALRSDGPLAINDCDHAFVIADVASVITRLASDAGGALLGFRADSAAYSYVRFDEVEQVIGTVEKVVASPFAIAGCYLFANKATFSENLETYRRRDRYAELFVSGLYDEIISRGGEVIFQELAHHVSFGTPEELSRVQAVELALLTRPGTTE